MTCGIYMIQNLVNGKMYIGQAVDIERRWRHHRSVLRGNDHDNKHLQRAWNKYGEDNFEFTIICECAESQLNTMEEYYIFELMSYDGRVGYNKTYGGEGCRPTEETRRKQSEAHKGENHYMFGKHHSEETKEKMSESLKGENNPMYGKHCSEETKSKLSIPILQIDPSTNKIVTVWKSAHDAERECGFNNGAIIRCCKNKFNREGNNIYKGYKWQYLSEYIHNIDPRIKKVILFDKEYEF